MDEQTTYKILKAAIHNDLEFIKNLKEFCPDFHWQNIRQLITQETALHYACAGGHVELMLYLLTSFEPRVVNVKAADMKTPLHCAAENSHHHIVHILLEGGADVNAVKNGDETAVMIASTKTGERALLTVCKLIKNRADLTIRNSAGWTALMLACKEGDLKIVKSLVHANPATIELKNRQLRFPIHIACLHGHLKIVEEILNRQANMLEVKDSRDHTPFLDAVLSGDTQIVKYLINCKGADKTARNHEGWNALHLAAGAGKNDMVEYLIMELNFDPNALTSDYKKISPLHCAAHSGCASTMELLERLNADLKIADWKGRTAKHLYESNIH